MSRCLRVVVLALCALVGVARAEDLSFLDKAHRILIERGLQVMGTVNPGDNFHIDTYKGLSYNTILWAWDSQPTWTGAAPGMPWARWVRPADPSAGRPQAEMPPLGNEGPYMSNLVALSLGDEPNLNDRSPGGTFDRYVQWFNDVRSQYPNTILFMNNWGSQLLDQNLSDFTRDARPDMLTFDTYPWRTDGNPVGGSPTDWFRWTRRYRVYAHAYGIPFGVVRQTFSSTSDHTRIPSASEQTINTMGALTFGATFLSDFWYNGGSTTLFDKNPDGIFAGDGYPNAAYARQATLNTQARNLGKALVRLKQVDDYAAGTTIPNRGVYSPNSGGHTTSMMFIRGKHMDGANVVYNDLPEGFTQDPEAPKDANGNPDVTKFAYSDWVFTGNDPYMNGGFSATTGVTNLGTRNNGLPGDVILSWFKPMDESFDGPNYTNERYLMILNSLTDPAGTPAECRQAIQLLFNFTGTNITMLERLDENTGSIVDVPLTSIGSGRYRLDLTLDGGMAALLKFKDGAPFVGVTPVPEPALLSLLPGIALLMRRRARRN